jgi:hypothetical protein
MIHPPFPANFDSPPLPPVERAFLDAEAHDETDGGHSAIIAGGIGGPTEHLRCDR